MKKSLLLLLLSIALTEMGCQSYVSPYSQEPIKALSISAKIIDNYVEIGIDAEALTSSGVLPTTFDEVEVWVAEDNPSNRKWSYTTKETTLKLNDLQADKMYYISAQATKNGQKTEISKPIMFINSTIKSVGLLSESSCGAYIKSSTDTPYLVYSMGCEKGQFNEIWIENWQTRAKKMIHQNSSSKHYTVKGFYDAGKIIILETTQNKKRAFEYYDMSTEKFINIETPADASIKTYDFSPDGKKMAYTDSTKQGLYIYNTQTKENRQLSNDVFYDFEWLKDGETIVQIRNKPTNGTNPTVKEVVRYKIIGNNPPAEKLLEWEDSNLGWASISPKQEYILFQSYVANNNDLWVYEIKTKKLWQISNVTYFGWLSDKEFFANVTYKGDDTFRYRIP